MGNLDHGMNKRIFLAKNSLNSSISTTIQQGLRLPDGRAHGYGKFKAANGNVYEGDWYQEPVAFPHFMDQKSRTAPCRDG